MLISGSKLLHSIKKVDLTKSIFDTTQEKQLFYAIRNVFSRDLVCPNLPLKTFIDIESMKSKFTPDEIACANAMIANFVVVDQIQNYKPKYVFIFEDKLTAASKNISDFDGKLHLFFEMCGLVLVRVPSTSNPSIKDFEKKLRRVLDTLSL